MGPINFYWSKGDAVFCDDGVLYTHMASTTTTTTTTRVRQILSQLNPVEKAELKKQLPAPKTLKMPAEPAGTRYPAALLSALNIAEDGKGYANLGHITEELVGLNESEITTERLLASAMRVCPTLTPALTEKIVKSKTTPVFLEHVKATARQLKPLLHESPLLHEATLTSPCGRLEGHPDYSNACQIFEVKMTGQLKQNWVDFLFQVFAYAALSAPSVTHIFLVLPLQEVVWGYDIREWKTGPKAKAPTFLAKLLAAIQQRLDIMPQSAALVVRHHIGSHMEKGDLDRKTVKTLADMIRALPAPPIPSQIFLGGPQSSRISLSDADIADAATAIRETGIQLYIHSQYLINLCAVDTGVDDYHTSLLIRNLQIATAIGARGVVVHVGKYTLQEPTDALNSMRTNLLRALQFATPECPILLETPAGQGTELLCKWEEFSPFVAGIADPRLRICVDTCHVFAAGHDPLTYVTTTSVTDIKLIHFNDSATPCGSCLDRHAYVGLGHIGLPKLTEIAEYATGNSLPMVIE